VPLKVLRGERRYQFLAAMLLTELALFPVLRETQFQAGLLAIIHTGILLAAVYAISKSRRHLIIGTVLAAPALIRAWIVVMPGITPSTIDVGGLLMTGALYGFVAWITLKDVFQDKRRVTTDSIMGGICTYLLAGYMFAALYMVVWYWNPAAFTVDMSGPYGGPDTPRFAYFSFVTLTTLGYGDISPVDPRAQALATLEAIAGVLYLATFVSRLVSDRRG